MSSVTLDADHVYAVGPCGTCESYCRVLVDNIAGQQEVDVRCGTCRNITTLRDFEPPSGRCPEDA